MVERFDRVLIRVADLDQAVREYRALFGCTPAKLQTAAGEVAWCALGNTVVELQPGADETPRIDGLVLGSPQAAGAEQALQNPLGLPLIISDCSRTGDFRREHPDAMCEALAIDHVVLRTDAAEDCIDLFRDQLGIRLALDKTVPEWGGRMLFFRAGKMTLEVIQSEDGSARGHYFWGVAYQCRDIDRAAGEMRERGVSLSGIRDGRKPGTRVATVKSHCLGIPTLLIEPA